MAARYEGDYGELDLELVDEVDTYDPTLNGIGYHGKLSTLLEWHSSDPVDSFEINRNNVIYSYQNNRNPFIDHPEYVAEIWGNTTSTALLHQNNRVKVYPNPAVDYIQVEVNGPALGIIYSLSGKKLKEFDVNSPISVRGIPNGIYILKILREHEVLQTKILIQ